MTPSFGTKDMMALRGLLEKSSDSDLLREMIGFAAERLMELEVGAHTGAALGEKSPTWLAQRNGYRERAWGEANPPLVRGAAEPRRHGRTADPQAAHRQLLPKLPGAAPNGREGADGGDPGSLHPGCFHPVGR